MEINSGQVSAIDDISEAWELTRSQYGSFFAMTIIMIAISFAVQFALSLVNSVITVMLSALIGAGGGGSGLDGTVIVQGVSYLTGTALGLVAALITGCLFCGFFMALARFRAEGIVQVGDLFKGMSRWQPCLAVAFMGTAFQFLILIVIGGGAVAVIASTIGLESLNNIERVARNPEILTPAVGGFVILAAIAVIISIIWSILQMMVLPLIARGEDFASAFVGSIKAGFSNFFGLLFFVIASSLLALLGLLACVVGVLFVLPILYVATFVVSEKIFGPVVVQSETGPPSPDQFGFSGGSGFQGQ